MILTSSSFLRRYTYMLAIAFVYGNSWDLRNRQAIRLPLVKQAQPLRGVAMSGRLWESIGAEVARHCRRVLRRRTIHRIEMFSPGDRPYWCWRPGRSKRREDGGDLAALGIVDRGSRHPFTTHAAPCSKPSRFRLAGSARSHHGPSY